MGKAYLSLDTIAHLFALQQIREKKHREKQYTHEPVMTDRQEMVRLETSSALSHCFNKILCVVEMTHELSEAEKEKYRDLTYSGESAEKTYHRSHYLLKEE